MFESMRPYDPNARPPGNDLLELMAEEGAGRISEAHADGCTNGTLEYNSTLAAFLVAAGNYSYYGCTQGWSLQTGLVDLNAAFRGCPA